MSLEPKQRSKALMQKLTGSFTYMNEYVLLDGQKVFANIDFGTIRKLSLPNQVSPRLHLFPIRIHSLVHPLMAGNISTENSYQ